MNLWLKVLKTTLAMVALCMPVALRAMQAPAPAAAPKQPKAAKETAIAAPSAQEIADAKAKALVWVNTSTKVYHKDGAFYGATKHGKFMTEDEATKAGYRAAKEPGSSRKGAAAKK